MASPESSTEVPQVNPAELRKDPDKVLDKYRDVATKPSWEVDALLNDALARGIFVEDTSDEARFDDTFTDKAEVQSGFRDVPEVQATIQVMKDRRFEAAKTEKLDKLWDEVNLLPTVDERIARLGFMLEDSYRRGEIDIIPGTPGRPEQKEVTDKSDRVVRPFRAATPDGPAQLVAKDKRQQAVKEAFAEILVLPDPRDASKELIPVAERSKLNAIENGIAKRKGGIDTEEKARRAEVQEHLKREARNREEAARARVEAATQATEDDTERAAQDKKLGMNQVVMRRGRGGAPATEVTDPAELARARKRLANTETRSRDYVSMTDKLIHTEALELNRQHDREMKYGTGPEAIARDEADAYSYDAFLNRAEKLKDVGRLGASRADQEAAFDEALAVDSDARGQKEVYDRYEAMINAEPDVNIKRHLATERDKAVVAEKDRLKVALAERAKLTADSMNFAADVRVKTSKREVSDDTVRGEQAAQARRQALNLDPVPFMEEKSGGIFHRKKNRGPKVVESYFRTAGDENLVVLERRNRRSGELLSQTVMTTEKEIRGRNLGQLPPRETKAVREKIREQDTDIMMAKAQGRISKFMGGSASPGDFVNFQGGGAIGSGNRIEGPDGVYQRYINQAPAAMRPTEQERLIRFRTGQQQRRGGFWYWVTGGRI